MDRVYSSHCLFEMQFLIVILIQSKYIEWLNECIFLGWEHCSSDCNTVGWDRDCGRTAKEWRQPQLGRNDCVCLFTLHNTYIKKIYHILCTYVWSTIIMNICAGTWVWDPIGGSKWNRIWRNCRFVENIWSWAFPNRLKGLSKDDLSNTSISIISLFFCYNKPARACVHVYARRLSAGASFV